MKALEEKRRFNLQRHRGKNERGRSLEKKIGRSTGRFDSPRATTACWRGNGNAKATRGKKETL